MTFIEYSKAMVGNWITVLLAIPFISFQFHMTSGIVLDIGLFMTSSMMRQSPLYLFVLLVFVVVALTVRSGIETMARMFIVPIVSVLLFVIIILVLSYPNYEVEHLRPIMPLGIKPVVLGAYFSYGFPYVEIVLMAMILPYVRKEKPATSVERHVYGLACIRFLFNRSDAQHDSGVRTYGRGTAVFDVRGGSNRRPARSHSKD